MLRSWTPGIPRARPDRLDQPGRGRRRPDPHRLLDRLRRGAARTTLKISLIRTLDTSVPDGEWSERTEIVGLRLLGDHGELFAHVSLATMVGASQYDEVRAVDGSAASVVATWVARTQELLTDPSHRLLLAEESRDPARHVTLREEHDGADHRWLGAHLDEVGNLHIDGQDLGPSTAIVSGDGEYEWFQTIPAASLPTVLTALGSGADENVIAVLEQHFTGRASYDLEAILRSGVVPLDRQVWSS